MSTNTYPNFFPSQDLGDTATPLVSVASLPATIQLQDLQLKFFNHTTTTRTVTAYAIPSGASAADRYAVVKDFPIPPNDFIIVPVPRVSAGGVVSALADTAASVNVQAIGGKFHTP